MTFNDILHKFRSESFTQKDKGTQFERLMRSWLLSDPRYSNLTKVWLWDDFPSRADLGGKDTGIDLVARTEEGDYWAIQCKCYKEDSVIDKPAVDSFLATSSRQFKDPETLQTTSFAKRMWISTTNHWGKNAEDAIQNQNPPFNRVGLVDLQNSPVDWQLLIDGLKGKEAMLPGKQPREHQLRAMSAAHAYFQEHDRGKLIMACGTGKTYTALKIAEDLLNNKGLVLFMVPSISLLGQSLNVLAAIIELKTPIIGAIGHVEEKLFIKQLVDKCAPTPNGLGQYFSEMVESANEKKTHSRAILTEQIKKQFKEQIDAGHKQNKELQEKLRVLTENQKKATEAQEIATKKHNEQVEAANKLNKELQDKLRVLTENQKKADEEQQIANKKHIEQIEAAQKQNQSLQEQLKTLNESQKKLQIIHQKQQEDLGKNLTKMQDANTLLQKSLEKATMQNAETLKELNHAKEQAKELEHSMSELKSKKGTNIWMWIAISAILILLCMLVL